MKFDTVKAKKAPISSIGAYDPLDQLENTFSFLKVKFHF